MSFFNVPVKQPLPILQECPYKLIPKQRSVNAITQANTITQGERYGVGRGGMILKHCVNIRNLKMSVMTLSKRLLRVWSVLRGALT